MTVSTRPPTGVRTRLAVGAWGGALLLSVESGGSSRLAGCPLGATDMQGRARVRARVG